MTAVVTDVPQLKARGVGVGGRGVSATSPPPPPRQIDNYIIMIIDSKGAIRDVLQSLHCAANCPQHAHSSGPGVSFANHV